MCRHFLEDFNLKTYVARYHNVYGPYGTWDGGREKAPAALCRKFVEAKFSKTNEIEIWGDGEQTRSFLYIGECVEAVRRLMQSETFHGPVNIGADQMISINDTVDLVAYIAGKTIRKKHIDGPTGVRGRNSNNELIAEKLKWSPEQNLKKGLEITYEWIYEQVGKQK
jgi:nucleoside-diphosphate-sugar epimerase